MPGTHDLWLFAATVLVVNATPGADMMLLLARTLRHGVRGGWAVALGIGSGSVVHALAAAFGLAALLAASASAFAVVKWAGAAYLLWLAFGMLRAAARPASTGTAAAPAGDAVGLWRLYRQGLFTNVLNPKVALFFLALLPQFIDTDAADKTLAFLFLGGWFVVQGTLFLVIFAMLVAPLARWRPSAAVERTLQGLGGVLFAGLAARLAWARP